MDSFILSKSSINLTLKVSNFSFKLILDVAIFNGVTGSLWTI